MSRTISGIALGALGAFILYATVMDREEGWIWGAVWGVILIGLGIYTFFNKKEDEIEEIKK